MEEYSEVAKMFRRVYTKLVYDQNTSLEVFLLALSPLKLYLDYNGKWYQCEDTIFWTEGHYRTGLPKRAVEGVGVVVVSDGFGQLKCEVST